MCTWQCNNYSPGQVIKLVIKGMYMIELAAHNNVPSGVVLNCSYVTPKAGQVAVILINTTNRNIWIHQPLLAAKICEVELHPWQYCSVLYKEGNTIKVGFQPIVPPQVEGGLKTNLDEVNIKKNLLRSLPLNNHHLDLIQIPPETTILMTRW